MSPVPDEYTHVRRQDRAVTDNAWIAEFLAWSPYGTVATSLDNQPFQHTFTFVYDPESHAIYFHTARDGRLGKNIATNPKVSFCAVSMGRVLPSKTARGFSVEYESVIAFGEASLVTDLPTGHQKLQLLMDKYAPHLRPGTDYGPTSDQDVGDVSVVRISIERWTAKRKAARPITPVPTGLESNSGVLLIGYSLSPHLPI